MLTYDPTVDDTFGPSITDMTPPDGSDTTTRRPTISALYSDATTGNSGVDSGSVSLSLDGTDRTSQATVTASQVTFTLTSDLALGKHTVVLKVKDLSTKKNEASKTWTFTLVEESTTFKSIVVEPATIMMEVGQTVTLTAVGIDDDGARHPGQAVTWTVTGGIGTMTGATFMASTVGTGSVKATMGTLTATASVTVSQSIDVSRIEIAPTTASLFVGEELQFTAKCYDSADKLIEGVQCTYVVVGTIGTVDATGKFVAGTVGSGKVKATYKTLSAEAQVEVKEAAGLPQFTVEEIAPEGSQLRIVLGFADGKPDGAEFLVKIDSGVWKSVEVAADGKIYVDISEIDAGTHEARVKFTLGDKVSEPQLASFTVEEQTTPGEEKSPMTMLVAAAVIGIILAVLLVVLLMTRRRGQTPETAPAPPPLPPPVVVETSNVSKGAFVAAPAAQVVTPPPPAPAVAPVAAAAAPAAAAGRFRVLNVKATCAFCNGQVERGASAYVCSCGTALHEKCAGIVKACPSCKANIRFG